jgi:hypothetical protein
MPGVEVRGQYQLRLLSARLREAGTEGQGLKRELMKAISASAKPLAAEVKNPAHLDAYLPNRYAAVLAADLAVGTQKRFGKNPAVAIRLRGRKHARKVIHLNAGILTHPVFARGARKTWTWKVQSSHVKAGFWSDAAKKATPQIRNDVLAAMHETTQKITGH